MSKEQELPAADPRNLTGPQLRLLWEGRAGCEVYGRSMEAVDRLVRAGLAICHWRLEEGGQQKRWSGYFRTLPEGLALCIAAGLDKPELDEKTRDRLRRIAKACAKNIDGIATRPDARFPSWVIEETLRGHGLIEIEHRNLRQRWPAYAAGGYRITAKGKEEAEK